MSRSTSSPFINVNNTPTAVYSGLCSRFKSVAIQPGPVAKDPLPPAISVAFGGESIGRETLLLPDMKGDGSVGRKIGQYPVDQSGESLSVPVMIDSIVSGDGISGRSSSVPRPLDEFGVGVEISFAPLSLSSRLRTRGTLLDPSKYDAFVKSTPLGPKPTILVRLFLVPVGTLCTTLCDGRIGESNLQACISTTLPSSSGCAIQRHVNKETRLIEGCLYIPASSSADKSSVFLEPTLPVSSLSPSKIQSLMLEKRTAEAWISLLPRFLSLPTSEASSLATVLDETAGKTTEYLSPSKLKRAHLSASAFFTKNSFLSSNNPLLIYLLKGVDPSTLASVLSIILDHADDVASTLQLVGRAVLATSAGFSADLSSLEVRWVSSTILLGLGRSPVAPLRVSNTGE